MNALEKLREQADLAIGGDASAWSLAERLVSRFPHDKSEASRVFKEKDSAGLDALVRTIEGVAEGAQERADEASTATKEEMSKALHAFRKRLKLARLSDESKLGGRYTSGGRTSGIDAIEPPNEFPQRVWRALVKEGLLIHTGQGFYAEPYTKGGTAPG